MFKRGDKVKVGNDPEAPYILQQLSLDEVYVVEEVQTDWYPADEETGMPEGNHTVVCLQEKVSEKWETVVRELYTTKWYDATWFVSANV